jgi:hypothetical protein
MPPTIRIDGEVYSWLQGNARPFEDTPNSVLRRIAGLEMPIQEVSKFKKTVSGDSDKENLLFKEPPAPVHNSSSSSGRAGFNGKQLNKEWEVGARHALFSREGDWYENLRQFPGALFDLNGYVLFETELDYNNCAHVSVKKKTNVRGSISSLPNYVRKGGA